MKLFSAFIALFISSLLFVSCQKQLSFDESSGTLKIDSLSPTPKCLPSSVNGNYILGTTLNSLNYIDVQVDVTLPGSFVIKTDTINHFSFYGTGEFPTTGINSARLYGFGTPDSLAGIKQFTVSYIHNNSECLIDVEVQDSTSSPNAVYTLGGAGTNCTGFTTAGTYMQGLSTNSSNTASMDVTVTTAGAYNLSTPVVNGVSFSATGAFTLANTGVTLIASGTPISAGPFTYSVTGLGGTTCSFVITFDPLSSPAVFTLGGSPGGCTGVVPSGSYDVGVAMNSSNTATIDVTVTTPGSYQISTNNNNGVVFTASGVFTATGPQQVILSASGTPTASGPFDYNVSSAGGSPCILTITYTAPVNNFITCRMNDVFTTFNVNSTAGLTNSAGSSILSIDGDSSTSTTSSINLYIQKDQGSGILAGTTYNVNQFASGISVSSDYYFNSTTTYRVATDPMNQSQTPGFTITVSTLTTTRCTGTFEGTLLGPAPTFLPIIVTEGTFDVPRQ